MPITARPPTTPPTMAPMGVDFLSSGPGVGVGTGLMEDEEEDEDVEVVGSVVMGSGVVVGSVRRIRAC